MSRIRTIKPDFWTDEKLTECSLSARLLFIGTWNFADDMGNLDRSSKQIKARVFPIDNIDCEPLLVELITQGVLIEYSVHDKKYLHIKGFHKHQLINRPSKPSCPEFNDSLTTHDSLTEDSLSTHDGRKGREGKEETLSGKPDETPHQEEQAKPKNESAIAVLEYLNEVAGTNYQPVKANIELIAGRMKEGATVEIMKAVIDSKFREWSGDNEKSKYLRPATLFNATKFAQYAGVCSPKNNRQHKNFRMNHLGFVEVHQSFGGIASWAATEFATIEEFENAQREAA